MRKRGLRVEIVDYRPAGVLDLVLRLARLQRLGQIDPETTEPRIRHLRDAADIGRTRAGQVWVTDQVPRLSLLSGEGVLRGRCWPALNGAHGMAMADGTVALAELNPSRVTRLARG